MEKEYSAKLLSLKLNSTFESFTSEFESALGRLNVAALEKAGHDPIAIETEIKKMQGEQGMTLFNVEDVGKLLSLTGPSKKAKRYFVGNYLRAAQIIATEVRLALYAPLRVLIYEAPDKNTYAEYELPSGLFSRLDNELITQSGFGLDIKLKNVIEISDKRGSSPLKEGD